MKEFTAQDLQTRVGEVQDAALQEPIAITHRGRKRHVLMSYVEFERLKKAAPRVYTMSEIPDHILKDLAQAEMDQRHNHLNKHLDE